jgi:hypothetical protein
MPNAQLDQFIHALEMKAVPPLVLAVLGAALLGFALKWIESRLVRMFRNKKRNADPPSPAAAGLRHDRKAERERF